MLTNEERELIKDNFDIYDLIEELAITTEELIDAFDTLIEDNQFIMDRISGQS